MGDKFKYYIADWTVILFPKEGASLGIIHDIFSSNWALLGLWTLSPLLKSIAFGGRGW